MARNQVPQAPVSRADGYVNMLNKYGTKQDNSTAYQYQSEGIVPDMTLTDQYEQNGLFARIIDAPAEEAVKHGFDLGLKNPDVQIFIDDMLETLEWEEKASTAIKWARLYGGAIGVMLIDDGGGIDEPLNWRRIRSIEELRIYERAVVYPDYTSLYNYDPRNPTKSATSKFGMPEYYYVQSVYGQFWVHESRCLIFRNGILPERSLNPIYRFWGMPEYVRVNHALREAVTSHSNGVKLLERSVQAIYKMRGLADLLGTEEGENEAIKRLQVIDMARGILNSIAIDAEGEDYDFKAISFAGVKDIIETTCNRLSAETNIPQTILFGNTPTGMNNTGEGDLENWYNYIERNQKLMLRGNLTTLLGVITRAGLAQGKLEEDPDVKVIFNPLWSMSETETVQVDRDKAQTAQIKMQTAQGYVDMGVLDPSEIRAGLASEDEYNIEEMLVGTDLEEGELWGSEQPEGETATPEETAEGWGDSREVKTDANSEGVGVIVVNDDGWVLAGKRADNGQICGPGGHIESGESPAAAAIRETQEEFGITPLNLKPLGNNIYLCTEYDGKPKCDNEEMTDATWIDPDGDEGWCKHGYFPPFRESLKLLQGITENPKMPSADSNTAAEGASNKNQKHHETLLTQAVTPPRMKSDNLKVDADEQEWITVNGTPVPLDDDGELSGEVGEKIQEGEENGQSGNQAGTETAGLGESSNIGAGGVAGGGSSEGELAVLSGGSTSGSSSGSPQGSVSEGSAGGDVRARIVDSGQYANIMKTVIDGDPAKYATVDFHSAEELSAAGAKTILGEGEGRNGTGYYGSVVKPDGDITGVFSSAKNGGSQAILAALENGGDKLDAYSVNVDTGEPNSLARLYTQHGFEPVARVPFNAEYAKAGVTPADIVVYKHNGDSAETVKQKSGNYAPPTKGQYDSLPVMDYDAAIKYRDENMS